MVSMWRVEGDAAGARGPSRYVLVALTADPMELPDVHRAIEATSRGRYRWRRITAVRHLATIPDGRLTPESPPFVAAL